MIRFSHIKYALSVFFVSMGALYAYSFIVEAAPTTCSFYKSGVPVPAGYGAAYNVFSPSQLLMEAFCGDIGVVMKVGAGQSDQVIYEKGYHYRNKEWEEIMLTGSKRLATSPAWIESSAEVVILNPKLVDGMNYVVAYVCTKQGGQWKCGCSDTSCAQGKWQLQTFNKPVPPAVDLGLKNLPDATIGVPYSATIDLPDGYSGWRDRGDGGTTPEGLHYSSDYTSLSGIPLASIGDTGQGIYTKVIIGTHSDGAQGTLSIRVQVK